MLIDKQLTDLVSGYDRLRHGYAELQREWRQPLLRAYAVRHELYERELAQHRRRRRTMTRWVLGAIAVALVDIVVGFLLVSRGMSWGTTLTLIGIVVGGLAAVAWLAVLSKAAPRAPDHPLRPPLRDQLFPPIYPRWREALEGHFVGDPAQYGTQGELAFVQALQKSLPDNYLLLHSVQLRHGDDVDVVAMGPSGTWVFEVKYWSGTITWREGTWHREKHYHARGGAVAQETQEVSQPPEEQWRRMAQDVARTIGDSVPQPASSALTRVRGGLVFTSQNAVYDIPMDAPFRWGSPHAWVQHLLEVDADPAMTERAMLQATQALLDRHQALNSTGHDRRLDSPSSMDDYARRLLDEVEAGVRAWAEGRQVAAE